jgi:hypothetical protein
MNDAYQRAGLVPLLETIRSSGRYAERNGSNVLTNAAAGFDREAVLRELHRAHEARHASAFDMQFENDLQGVSYGLNPYTDWSLKQLEAPPKRWSLFLGLDWYRVTDLCKELPNGPRSWFDYLDNPFIEKNGYFRNVWAWILRKSPPWSRSDAPHRAEDEAASFLRSMELGFIFHNLIPYLRPAREKSSSSQWPDDEWKKRTVHADVVADLRQILVLSGGRISAYCTNQRGKGALLEAGFPGDRVMNLSAHPARVWNYTFFAKKNTWFTVRD